MLTTYGVVTGTPLARPGYKGSVREYAGYATQITRVTGDSGVVVPIIGGIWNKPWSRHRYSKRQPWSSDGAKLLIDQKSVSAHDGEPAFTGDPSRMVLNATNFAPEWSSRDNTPRGIKLRGVSEVQWRPGFPTHMVCVRKGAAANTVEVEVFDTATEAGTTVGTVMVVSTAASGAFPQVPLVGSTPDLGWAGECQISDNGRWTVLTTRLPQPQVNTAQHDYIVVIDLLNCVVGGRNDVSYATQAYPSGEYGLIGNCGISCLGLFAEVKLSGDTADPVTGFHAQPGFILDVSQTPPFVCTPHPMDPTPAALRMGSAAQQGAAGAALGVSAWLSHPDFNIDSAGNEVIVGGGRQWEACNFPADTGKLYGDTIMVNLTTGIHTHVGPGSHQVTGGVRFASFEHGSGRAYGRRGWHVITTDVNNRAASETMWVRLLATNTPTGTRSIERMCKLRTNSAKISAGGGGYNAEAQAVAKPDGTQVIFASNWQGIDVNPPGPHRFDSKGYIVSNTLTAPVPPPTGGPQGPYRVRVDV